MYLEGVDLAVEGMRMDGERRGRGWELQSENLKINYNTSVWVIKYEWSLGPSDSNDCTYEITNRSYFVREDTDSECICKHSLINTVYTIIAYR